MNKKHDEIKIDKQVNEELDSLIALLQKREEITHYQEVETQIESNDSVNDLVSQIKEKQKELVHLQHYEKPVAYQKSLKELEKLYILLNENISVQAYQEALFEANETIQMIFMNIREEISDRNE